MKLTLGYIDYAAPHDYYQAGPFHSLFSNTINLETQDSLKGCDAIVVWGGSDISPTFYDEKPIPGSGPEDPTHRDMMEWHMITEAHKDGIPMIGVCRGAQMMCAYAGGKLVQHCNNHNGGRHLIDVIGNRQFMVSSVHHQMMYPYDVPHELIGWMSKHRSNVYEPVDKQYCIDLDQRHVKEPEIVLFKDINAMGVQCHPEYHHYDDPFNVWFNELLFQRFFK